MSTSYVAILPELPEDNMPEEIRKSIKEIISYMADSEWQDFQEWLEETAGDPTGHIYYHVRVVDSWLQENPSEEDRCPRCGLIDNGEADYIKDHGHCRGCHVAWQHGELPEQQEEEEDEEIRCRSCGSDEVAPNDGTLQCQNCGAWRWPKEKA